MNDPKEKSNPSGDPLIDWMQKNGIPVTRQNYLDLAYPEGIPELTAELESLLPEELQLGA